MTYNSSSSTMINHRGQMVPSFLYGTAWKEEQTEALTKMAVESGFVGIDTANQRRHYDEEGVGEAVRSFYDQSRLGREGLFLQSKFTFAASQDHRIPYDPKAGYAVQVEQSLTSSLAHLHTDYLDAYLLHGPFGRMGLGEADWQVWRQMESFQEAGKVRLIGVSNVDLAQLQLLVDRAKIKPAFVQNRCYAHSQWDYEIRSFCREHDICYQGFSLLTANERALNRPEVYSIMSRRDMTLAQVVFRFAFQIGIIPITGTRSQSHMLQDLAIYDFELDQADIDMIEQIAV